MNTASMVQVMCLSMWAGFVGVSLWIMHRETLKRRWLRLRRKLAR